MKKDNYTLTFQEAIEKCLKGEGFIRGDDFAKGVYVKPNKDGILIVIGVNEQGWHEEISTFMITHSVVFRQKYKLFSVANKEALELIEG
ncbi:hypothetical protein CVD28_01955 [Bacillus sp. M6-12]|uniref:hypothetical protein n=1 Tax=Bacillus sp. M6-12 TaxID=2054166 RepID=UPI000C7798DC|nr:hypothetical protein [Bacillus sp. M6-12]PLS19196.1 hypothetical protein CVD28_01955 [Bacillus sp. M6-12]